VCEWKKREENLKWEVRARERRERKARWEIINREKKWRKRVSRGIEIEEWKEYFEGLLGG